MRRRPAGDEGVVAIVVALSVSTFLLVFGAFAVDFGNAFARRQNLQTAVDLAALAGAAMLPDRSAALGKIHESLCSDKNENTVDGWAPSVCAGNGWMTDTDTENGQVTFYGPDTDGSGRYEPFEAAAGGVEATALRIVTPKAHVEFGLGQITGASGVDLARAATAKVGSVTGPGGVQPIPVTPDEPGTICLSDTTGTAGTAPVDLPDGDDRIVLRILAGLHATPKVTDIRVGLQVGIPGLLNVTVWSRGYTNAGAPLGDQVMGTGNVLGPYQIKAPDYPVGSYVYLYARVQILGVTYTSDFVPVDYGVVDNCGQVIIRRNYVREPRFTGTGLAVLLNLQAGIDHAVRPWTEYPPGNPAPTVPQGQCGAQPGTAFRSGGAPLSTVNCLTVADDVDVVGDSHPPYLDVTANGTGLLMADTCPNSDRGDINGHPDRDVTSMFRADFTPGGPSGTIAGLIRAGASPTAAQRGSLSSRLLLCPRLFTVPVLDAPTVDRAIGTGSYPVQGFRYLYLEPTNANGASYGFTFSNRTVTRINAIVIDPAWFPETAALPLPIGEYLGENLTKQVALVHDYGDPDT
jgi:hypothetical protein